MTRRSWLALFALSPFGKYLPTSWRPTPIAPTRLVDRETGIAIRFVKQFDIATTHLPARLDVYVRRDP